MMNVIRAAKNTWGMKDTISFKCGFALPPMHFPGKKQLHIYLFQLSL
jgi:hypothetical protein